MDSTSGVWSLKKIKKDESLWEEAQKKTFCGWINMHLAKRNIRVQDLSTDLSDGVKLIALLEILHGATIEGRYYRNPKSKPYKIDNVNFALNFITDTLKIQLISCSAEDVVDGNTKIILGMCWRLIQKFQLSQENSRAVLLNWCKQLASKYGLLIENFQSSFDNGLAFCALIHYYNNSLLDYSGLKAENKLHNLNLAFSLAEEHMEIPQLLDATDISNGIVDERSIMTYLSMIHHAISLKVPSELGNEESTIERVNAPSIPIIRTGSFNPSEQVVVNNSASATVAKPQSPGGDNSHLYAEIASLKEKVTFLEAQISTSGAAERELQSQLESTRRDLANALSKAKDLENQLESANQQNSNLTSQLRSVEQQLASKSDHETSKELETRSEPQKKDPPAQETQEDSTKDESKTETTKGDDSSTEDDSKQEATDDSKTQQSEEPSSRQEPKPAEPPKVEAAEKPKEEAKAPEPAKVEEPAAEKPKEEPKEEVKEVKVEEPVETPAPAVVEQKEEPKELPNEQATREEPAKVVETKAEEPKAEVKVEVPPKVEEQIPKAPVEVSKDIAPAAVPQLSSSEQEKLVADLQTEIAETREKLRQQVKVSETLQKSLEDTREEIVLIQKRQKRTQDKALKKQQKKYEKRIQRRDREIENLKKNAQVELQQKTDELSSVNKQLKKAQKALGTTVAPHTSALDADIEYLKQQKDQLNEIVQLFEEEEKAMAKKSTRRIEDDEEKGERSEETEA